MSPEFIAFIQGLVQLLGLVGLVVGASAGIAYFLFRRFGEKWIETKFETQLASNRHEQQKELEQIRFKVNALLDRTIKLHQREFEVMPEAWSNLNDAYWKTMRLVSPVQFYPDLTRMTNDQFLEFVNSSILGDWEKKQLLTLPLGQRNGYYKDYAYWPQLVETREKIRDMYAYLTKSGIFLRPDVKEKFMNLADLIAQALYEDEFHKQNPEVHPQARERRDALNNQGDGLLKELEAEVHTRLWGETEITGPEV